MRVALSRDCWLFWLTMIFNICVCMNVRIIPLSVSTMVVINKVFGIAMTCMYVYLTWFYNKLPACTYFLLPCSHSQHTVLLLLWRTPLPPHAPLLAHRGRRYHPSKRMKFAGFTRSPGKCGRRLMATTRSVLRSATRSCETREAVRKPVKCLCWEICMKPTYWINYAGQYIGKVKGL